MSFARNSPRGDAMTVHGKIDKQLRSNRARRHFARRLIVERLEERRLLAVLFSHDADDTVRAIAPSESAYNNFGLDWIGGSEPFNDSAWQTTSGAANGVGYDRGNAYDTLLGLDLESPMHGARSTLFARAEFNVADPSAVDRLTLNLRYDDGFIAWLNGVEVARANADSVYPAWSATATAEHQASTTEFETFDLAAAIASLQTGTNILAIRGLNLTAADEDALIQFTLVGESRTGPPLAVNDSATTEENVPVTIDVLANDQEGSGAINPASVVIASPPAHGTAIANSDGTITYTPNPVYNGPDTFTYTVRDGVGVGQPTTQTLVSSTASARALVPTNNNLGTTWRGGSEPFDDSAWRTGTLGVGFEASTGYEQYIGLDVRQSMYNINGSVYVRSTFMLGSPADVTALTLRMRYDDGFVAFVNGVQIAAANAPTGLSFSTLATGDRPDAQAVQFESFDATSFISALRPGLNVLAIQGLNIDPASSDMLVQPELTATIHPRGQVSNAATVTVNVTGVDYPPIARDDAYSVDEGQRLEATTSSGGGPTTSTIIPANSTWLFRDNGIVPPNDAQGDTWKQADFDDSGWVSGPAQLGYGDGDEGTVVNCGPSRPSCNSNNHITTWFRKHFTLEPGVAARATAMVIELMRDDAAAVYVNGVEVIRSNLPGVLGDNAVTPQTPATTVATTADESTFLPPETRDLTLEQYRNLLRDGDNVIAVEVHQNDPNSSDVTFDLRMSLTVAVSGGVLGNDTEPDGQSMTAVLATGPAHGTLDFHPDGTFTYTPDPLYYGPDAFTYRATDGTLFSTEATVTIDVQHLPPVAVADSFAIDEDTPLIMDAAGGVLANDTDTQNHTLTAQLVATTEHGVLALAADGSFSYVPDQNFHGSDQFIYRATDGQLQSTPVNVTITVRSIDDPSVATNDAYEVSSGGTLTVDFPRSLGGPIPGGSRATPLASGGQLIYDRHRDILYRVSASGGTIQRYRVATNTLLPPFSVPNTVTEGDITPDGRALYFADSSTGLGVGYIRKVSLDDGSLTTLTYSRGDSEAQGWDLAIGANGIARFSTSYAGSGSTPIRRLDTATDTFSSGGSAYMRSSIHSGPDQSLLVYINSWISSYPISTADGVTGESIAGISLHEQASDGVAAISRNGQLVALNCCAAGLNIRDRNLNLVRDLTDLSSSVAFDAARDIFYAIQPAADPNPDQLVAFDTTTWQELYRIPTGVNPTSYGKMLTSANGQFAFVQTNSGVHMIDILNAPQVIVQAGSQWKYLDNGSDQGTAWREPGFNDYFWPTGNAQFGFGDGDETTGISYGGSASAKHVTTYFRRTFQVDDPAALEDVTLSLLADDGAAVYLNGVAIARRNLAAQASHTTFAFTSVDGAAESQYFDFAVDPALLRQGENVLAVEVHIRSAADDDMSFDLRLTANAPRPAGVLSNDTDGDGESLTAQLVAGPQFGTLNLNPNGTFTYQSNPGFAGADTFTYRAVTASGQSAPATVTIDVGAVTGRPNVNSFAYTAVEDEPLAVAAPGLLAGATDAEGGPLTSALTGPPLHGVVSIAADGSFVYTPEPGFNGQDAFIFAASDGSETSNRGIVTITVAARGDVPVAVDDEYTIDRGTSLVFAAPATSPETIAQTSFTEPATNSVSYTGGAELGFTASTTPSATELGVLASDQYIVRGINVPLTLSFSPVDLTGHRQVAVRIAVRAHEDSTGSDFEDTDYFRAHLGLARIGGPVVLQTIVDLNGAELKAIDNGLAGAFTTYLANIPDGFLSATLTIETLVDSSTERVFFDDISFSGVSLTGGNLLLANDTDEDGDELTVRIVSQPSHGTLETDENGAMVYRPEPSFVGDDTFTYVANDGIADSNVATVSIHVLLANLPPTAGDDAYGTSEDVPLVVDALTGLLANDADFDGDALTAVVVTPPQHGTLSLLPDGSFTYTPAENYFGSDSFTYKATDGRDDSNVASVTIAVSPVNDPPVAVDDAYTTPQGTVLDIRIPQGDGLYADSIAQFSGLHGYENWYYGYYNRTTDSDAVYQPVDFIQFPRSAGQWQATNFWDANNNRWKWFQGNPPWTEILADNVHPNGTNNGHEHWPIRRWISDVSGSATIVGNLAKLNTGGGDGVRGIIYVDGAIVYNQTIAGNDGSGVDFRFEVSLTEGALVDFVLSPNGNDAQDGTYFNAKIYAAALAPSNVGVIARGATWSYRDDITNGSAYPADVQGDLWNESDYDDSAWPSGPAMLGYGEIVAGALATTIGYGGNASDKYRTALFRRTFEIDSADRVTTLSFDALFDDGAAIYINGREVRRHNLPGTVGDNVLRTDTFTNSAGDEATYTTFSLDLAAFPGLLVDGTNTIAVEVHQVDSTSSDLGFDLSLTATVLPDPQAEGVLANDVDAEGDALTAEVFDQPQHGSLAFTADGLFVYTPAEGFYGRDSFTYRASDGATYSNVATVEIVVTRRLIANDDVFAAIEDNALAIAPSQGVLANDPDAGDPSITALLEAAPEHGTFTLAPSGAFLYRSHADYFGDDTFTYRVTDGIMTSAPATVTITVAPVNDAPSTKRDTYSIDVGQTLDTAGLAGSDYAAVVLASDPVAYWRLGDNDGSTAVDVAGGLDGAYVGGIFPGQAGALTDDADTSTEFDGQASYINVGYRPELDLIADFSISAWILPYDIAGEQVIVGNPGQFGSSGGYSMGVIDGRLSFRTHGQGDMFTDPVISTDRWYHVAVVYTAGRRATFYVDGRSIGDGLGAALTAPSNHPFRIGAGDLRYWEGQIDEVAVFGHVLTREEILEQFLTGRKFLADSLASFSGTQGRDGWHYGYYNRTTDANGTYQPSDFTPFPNAPGAWRATNFYDTSVDRWHWFNGDPPWTAISDDNMNPNGANNGAEHWPIRRWVSDVAGPVTITGSLRLTTPSDQSGVIAYVFVDGVAVYTRTMHAGSGAEVWFAVPLEVEIGSTVDFAISPNGNDISDTTRFVATVRAGVAAIEELSPRAAVWNYRDDLPNNAAYPVDGEGHAWTEIAYNDAAWRVGRAILGYDVIDAGPIVTTIRFGDNANDKYRTALFRRSFQVDQAARVESLLFELLADDGAAVYINGVEVYRHNLPGELGDSSLRLDTFTTVTGDESDYTTPVIDLARFPGVLVDGTNTVAVEVHQVSASSSDLGFDLAISAVLAPDPVGRGVLGNDRDAEGDAMTAALVAGPYHGVLDFASDGTFTYTPNAGFEGVDQFTYRANDGTLDSALALVTINVGNANLAPLAADDRFVARSGTALSVAATAGVLANDFDPNGDLLSTTVFALPMRGTLSLAADGSFVYTPSGGFLGVDSFTYRVADDNGTFGFATATIHVVPKIDPINGIPLVADDVFAVAANTVHSVSAPGVLANDRDPELRPLVAVVEQSPWHGSLSFAADGSFTYTPSAGFTGADAFTYRVTDSNTFSAPATVVLNVAAAIPAGGVSPPLPPSSTPTGSTQLPGPHDSTSLPGTLPASGDLNGDGRVDRADLTIVIAAYGSTSASPGYSALADLSGDGRVSIADAIVLRNRMSNPLHPASSSALVQRASDRLSSAASQVDAIAATTLRLRATADLQSSDAAGSPLRAARLNQPRPAIARPANKMPTAAVDEVLASDAGMPTALAARRTGAREPRSS